MATGTARSFDGTTIWFEDSGGDGPSVLLVHGATVSSRTNFGRWVRSPEGDWRAGDRPTIGAALRDAGARVVGLDLRGHGRSGWSADPERYRGDASAFDVVAVADELGLRSFDAVGYSMGASVLMRLLDREPRLRSVALCGTGPFMVSGDEPWTIGAVGAWFLNNAGEDDRARVFKSYAELDEHDFASIAAALTGTSQAPLERLAAAECAVLVLNGGNDDGDDDAARLPALIAGAQAVVARDGDHGSAANDRTSIAVLLAFLSERW